MNHVTASLITAPELAELQKLVKFFKENPEGTGLLYGFDVQPPPNEDLLFKQSNLNANGAQHITGPINSCKKQLDGTWIITGEFQKGGMIPFTVVITSPGKKGTFSRPSYHQTPEVVESQEATTYKTMCLLEA